MSFILDALKKSEQERERQQQPTTLELPHGRHSRTQPLWMIIVMSLLLLNCVLLLAMWWRNRDHQPPAVAATTAPASGSAAAIQKPPLVIAPRATEVRPLQDEAGNDAPVADAEEPPDHTAALLADAEPAGPPLVRPATRLEQAMTQQETLANRLKANSPGNSTGATPDGTPTLDSLGGSSALNLPALRLDVHVYSARAGERFVFINSHKYLEGQTLGEGPYLEKITQDGAILNFRNQRFLLPRQ